MACRHVQNPGHWVEADFFCHVNYPEWTKAGRLRGVSFDR
jgi:hypothetical protein